MAKLGVNIDHVATLRQARREFDPDPVKAALLCQQAGADSIVAHLREDRRHIQDKDILRLKKKIKRLNLEMSLSPDIVAFALRVKPHQVTLVPEKRQELTTEGGLNVTRQVERIKDIASRFHKKGIEVSLFIDPAKKQIDATHKAGVRVIELHTGVYDTAHTKHQQTQELKKLKQMTAYARSLGITVNAGHGLKYHNARAIARIPGMHELNIGHSIICESVFTGLPQAVRRMKKVIQS